MTIAISTIEIMLEKEEKMDEITAKQSVECVVEIMKKYKEQSNAEFQVDKRYNKNESREKSQ